MVRIRIPPKCRVRNPLLMIDILSYLLGFLVDNSPPIGLSAQPFGGPKGYFATVAALARTCRALSEPSLNALWRKLYSLEPLLLCFQLHGYDLAVPPTPEQWASVHRYSSRVWEVDIRSDGGRVLQFLETTSKIEWPAGSFLLPNLKLLRFIPFIDEHFSLVQKLLSPTLVSFHGKLCGEHSMEFDGFVAKLPVCCPNLKSIALQPSSEEMRNEPRYYKVLVRKYFQDVSKMVYHENLKYAGIMGPVDSTTFRYLATSPTLIELVGIWLNAEQWEQYEAKFPLTDTPFRNLRRLCLELEDDPWPGLDLVTKLLQPRDQPLHTVMLNVHSPPPGEAVTGFLAAMVTAPRIHSLQSIILEVSYLNRSHEYDAIAMDPSRTRCWFAYGALCPLKSLAGLRELVVSVNGRICITDDEFEDLVRNWPFIQELCLYPFPSWLPHNVPPEPQGGSVTLNGLLPLITHCPELQRLCLPIDAREVPVETDPNVRHNAITRLSFPMSPANHPNRVAAFLLKHFPSLLSLWGGGLESRSRWNDEHNPWAQVYSTLKSFKGNIQLPVGGIHRVPWTLYMFALK